MEEFDKKTPQHGTHQNLTLATRLARQIDSLGLARSNRIVVFGSRGSGAGDLVVALREFLSEKGIHNPAVSFSRNIDRISEVFYGSKNPGDIETIPKGVVTFPTMRLYDLGGGLDVPTYGYAPGDRTGAPIEQIQALCDKHGVPLVMIVQSDSPRELREKLSLNSPPGDS